MADIDLERKERSWLPWVIAGIVAVLVIWGIAEVFDRDAPVAADPDLRTDPALIQPAPAAEMPGDETESAIAEFRQTCVGAPDDGGDMGRQHQFTIACLESMAAAMDAVVRADTVGSIALDERLNTLRDRAADVRSSDPAATTHAGTVAAAFDAGAEVVEAYQDQRGTAADEFAAGVREAADALSADQPLLEQQTAVRDYFREMADALQAMAR